MNVRVTVDAFPSEEFTGTIEAVNPRIDHATRNVSIRATLPNPDERLRPGMFCRVSVDLPETRKVIVLPTAAIVYNPYGNAVYVVSEEKTGRGPMFIARQQFVVTGATRGSQVAILSGLEPGDQVVTSGQIKLALREINVRQYPVTNNAVVSVMTFYPGASADLVRGFITTPFEREIALADGIDYLESFSASTLSIAGAMVFLFLGFATLNIYTQVGLITLVGLITKHGILIVDFANRRQDEGQSKREAIEHAAGVRLRPILMTTAAMVLGVVPLVIASGAGAEARCSMGLVIAAGMAIGTCFTLFVVPPFYLLVGHDRQKQFARTAARATPVEGTSEAAH